MRIIVLIVLIVLIALAIGVQQYYCVGVAKSHTTVGIWYLPLVL